jgi:tRNA dimethylallyltransferase
VTIPPHNPGFIPTIYFLVGPTAVGKTALSLAAAETLGAEILSADSLCFYRGMDLGTAKPTASERAQVPHHGIDLVEPSEQFSVEAYARLAEGVVADCAARGKHVLVVGGSGFYVKSFFAPMSDGVEVSPEVAAEVARLEAGGGLGAMLAALAPFDRDEAAALDRRNPRRVAKALERCLQTGRPLRELQDAFAALPAPYAAHRKQVCLLQRPAEELRSRVRRRVAQMLAEGLIDEVKGLREAGIEANPSAAGAIGYRETLAYLRGELGREELAETIAVHTDQLIRKQRIWFRRQIPVHITVNPSHATVEEAFPSMI